MTDLGLQIVIWVMAGVILAAAVVTGVLFCLAWVADRVRGWIHRRRNRIRLR
jgi:hypothetical protein